MVFEDRVSAYPNRYTMTTEDGGEHIVTLERADNPTTEGTPLNADTFNETMLCYAQHELHPGCYCRSVGEEREWMNPPMNVYSEFRTMERIQGKPVYRKLLGGIDLPLGGAHKEIGTGLDSGCRIVGINSWIESEERYFWSTLPVFAPLMPIFQVYVLSPQTIRLDSDDFDPTNSYFADLPEKEFDTYKAYIELKYTK